MRLFLFERFLQLPLYNKWRNQYLHKRVHQSSRVQCDFDRVLPAEVNFGVMSVSVSSAITYVLDCHEDVFKFLRKVQGFDFGFEPRGSVVRFDIVRFSNNVTKALNACSKKGAGRSGRKVGDLLSFNEQFLY